jgi:hypothetical protein
MAEESSPSLLELKTWRESPWQGFKRIAEVFGIITPLVLGFVHFALGQQHEVLVQTGQPKRVYPSEASSNVSLPLTFNDLAVTSASVIDVEITNTGKSPVGTQEGRWTLELAGSPPTATFDAARIEQPPPSKAVLALNPNPAKNVVSVSVGLLDPYQTVHLRIMVLNAGDKRISFEPTSSLRGLPAPKVTDRTFVERTTDMLVTPLAFAALASIIVSFYLERRRRSPEQIKKARERPRWKRWGQIPLIGVVWFFGTSVIATFSARGIAWGIQFLIWMNVLE